jgi:hypothetical protein
MTIYGMLTEAGDGIKRVEVDASEFHATHAPEAEEIWVQGLNTLLRAMDPFDGYRPGDDRAHVADQNPDLQHVTPSRRPAAIAFSSTPPAVRSIDFFPFVATGFR